MRVKEEKIDVLKWKELKSFSEFREKYKNHSEKRKYFNVSENMDIIEKEPSFIYELAYFYYKNPNNKIEKSIDSEFSFTYLEKDKKIKRHSSLTLDNLKDSFFRSMINKKEKHSISLANELIRKDSSEFFCIMYKIALISSNSDKFVKLYFFEKIYNEIGLDVYVLKNLINYFAKSCPGFLKFEKAQIEFFIENKIDALYKKIYEENIDIILKKYNIDYKYKIEIKKEISKEELSDVKKVILELI